MENLQHDPRTKMQIRDLLFSFLYTTVEQSFKHRLESLIMHNTVIIGATNKLAGIGDTHKSFIYRGEIYSMDKSTPPRKMNRLSPKLVPDMDKYLRELKQLNEYEVPFVVGYINRVLNSSNDLYDYLRMFPKSIHPPIEKLIASYPHRATHLTDEEVQGILDNNTQSISLIKQRMAINLVI